MVQTNLNFEIDGAQELSRFFDLVGGQMSRMQPVFEKWGDDFRQTQHGVFAGEGAFEGRQKWAELSPKYREWKDANYPGQPILVLTGAMRGSLTDKSHGEHIFETSDMEMAIGTRVPYAIFHQRGTEKMPQRKVIELTDPQKLRWVQIARRVTWEQIQDAASEAGVMVQWQEGMARDA